MVFLSPLSLPGSSTAQRNTMFRKFLSVTLAKYKLVNVNLSRVLPHQDLSAIREFEHNRKPICPNKFMAVKEKV